MLEFFENLLDILGIRSKKPIEIHLTSTHLPNNSDENPNLEFVKEFNTKLVGVTFKNDDGSSRQELLSLTAKGDNVFLIREPNNKYDKYAIAVKNNFDDQLGYLSSSDDLARFLDNGGVIDATVKTITVNDKYGCIVHLKMYKNTST